MFPPPYAPPLPPAFPPTWPPPPTWPAALAAALPPFPPWPHTWPPSPPPCAEATLGRANSRLGPNRTATARRFFVRFIRISLCRRHLRHGLAFTWALGGIVYKEYGASRPNLPGSFPENRRIRRV